MTKLKLLIDITVSFVFLFLVGYIVYLQHQKETELPSCPLHNGHHVAEILVNQDRSIRCMYIKVHDRLGRALYWHKP
jgi:hypothetical protein